MLSLRTSSVASISASRSMSSLIFWARDSPRKSSIVIAWSRSAASPVARSAVVDCSSLVV
jgi:hypothetical protein